MKNTANTHVVAPRRPHPRPDGGRPPTELAPDLETVGEYDFGGALHGPMTAHPKVDPATGEMVFFGYSPVPAATSGSTRPTPAAPSPWSTEVDLPGAGDDARLRRHRHQGGVLRPARRLRRRRHARRRRRASTGRPSAVPASACSTAARRATRSRWIEVDPFWVFHFLNAHDDGDDSWWSPAAGRARLNTTFGDEELDEPVRPIAAPLAHRPGRRHGHRRAARRPARRLPPPRRPARRARQPLRVPGPGRRVDQRPGRLRLGAQVRPHRRHQRGGVYGHRTTSGEPVFAADPDDPAEDAGWVLNLCHDWDADESVGARPRRRHARGGGPGPPPPPGPLRLPRQLPAERVPDEPTARSRRRRRRAFADSASAIDSSPNGGVVGRVPTRHVRACDDAIGAEGGDQRRQRGGAPDVGVPPDPAQPLGHGALVGQVRRRPRPGARRVLQALGQPRRRARRRGSCTRRGRGSGRARHRAPGWPRRGSPRRGSPARGRHRSARAARHVAARPRRRARGGSTPGRRGRRRPTTPRRMRGRRGAAPGRWRGTGARSPRSVTARRSSATARSGSCIGSCAKPRSRSGARATSAASSSLWRRQKASAHDASAWAKRVNGFGDSTWRSMPERSIAASRASRSMNGLPR